MQLAETQTDINGTVKGVEKGQGWGNDPSVYVHMVICVQWEFCMRTAGMAVTFLLYCW